MEADVLTLFGGERSESKFDTKYDFDGDTVASQSFDGDGVDFDGDTVRYDDDHGHAGDDDDSDGWLQCL